MRNKIVDLKKAIAFSEGSITSRVLVEGKESETTLFCLAAGTSLSEHTSGREATIVVLKGNGIFNLAGKEVALQPGIFIFMPAGTKHSLRASENLSFLLILS